ncbi:MAG TPA: transketolase [Pseudolabrys sp.]|nr:transketolase [Pseudolabrys sp.]
MHGNLTGAALETARARCKAYRRRILEVSQQVPALHIGGAFSAVEMVDSIYNELMRTRPGGNSPDTFIMSKGHGCMIQYVVLESLGILKKSDLDDYSTARGQLGVHPDYGNPGIEASTGALGHGLSMAVGMALANRINGNDGVIYTVMSDGEVQEGSIWEATLMATSLRLNNLVAFVDYNQMVSIGPIVDLHPHFYPLVEKFRAFGWECVEIDGHDNKLIVDTVNGRSGDKPLMVIARTVKGKGVSYMENVPMWHYRSPNKDELRQAMQELE